GYTRRSSHSSSGFPPTIMRVGNDSRSDIYRGQTRGLVPPLRAHHRPQAHPRRPRQPIPQRRHATVLAPLLLERQKLAPTKSKPATTHNETTSAPTTRPCPRRSLRAVPPVEFPLA